MPRPSWLQQKEQEWQQLTALLEKAELGSFQLAPNEIRTLGLLYRSLTIDLSRVRTDKALHHLEPYLNHLLQRCHGRLYERPPTTWSQIRGFFTTDFPRCFRRNWRPIGLAFVVFALGMMVAMVTVHTAPETETYFLPPDLISQLDHGTLWTDTMQANPSQSSFLMTNNIRVAINAFAFGILFGVGTLGLLFHNGLFAVGGPLQVCFEHGIGWRLVQFMLAHGVIELSTIFIAGGAGMMIGFACLLPGDLPRWEAVRLKSKDSIILIAGCVPLLIIAGLIEGLVSLNADVPAVIRLAVALASAVGLIGYLGFGGKSDDRAYDR